MRDNKGDELVFDDNSGNGDDPQIIYTATSTGNYFLDVGDVKDKNIGHYEISANLITDIDDYSSDVNTIGVLNINDKKEGKIDFKSDRDWFKIILFF